MYSNIKKTSLNVAALRIPFTGCFFSILIGLLLASNSIQAAEKPLRNVADLRYGVVLYEYFQGNHFASLSELMVAKEQSGIQGHKDNPELIEGSLNLAFGMEQQAGEIYNRLLNENKPLAVRNAAWFYLAKIRYQRGELESVKKNLDNIVEPISSDLIDEMAAMKIQLLIKEGKFEEAEQQLKQVSRRGTGRQFEFWRPYINFNLGAIYARYEKPEQAQRFFSKVAKERLSKHNSFHQEQLALYDKAFTASAYSYFQQQDFQKAVNEFGNVRQSSPLANDALLGLGWAKAKQEDYRAALVPWTVLSQRPMADDAVQESLIAIPFAYLQLGDTARALDAYAQAEEIFIKELALIDEAGTKILDKPLIDLFKLNNDGVSYSWLVPENNYLVEPVSRYLLPLFSLNRFQNSVQSLFDLNNIRLNMEAWAGDLDAYDDLMNYRLTTFRLQAEPEGYRNMAKELVLISEQRNQFAAMLNKAKQENNVFMMLDEERQDLLSMVESGEANAALLKQNGENVDEESTWLKRYRGMMLWSANLDFDERIWTVESQINEIDAIIASSNSANSKITSLLTEAPDIQASQSKIDQFKDQVNLLLTDNSKTMASIEENLRAQLFASLALQRQRVQFYLGEARLAVAQLYDNKYLERAQQ